MKIADNYKTKNFLYLFLSKEGTGSFIFDNNNENNINLLYNIFELFLNNL